MRWPWSNGNLFQDISATDEVALCQWLLVKCCLESPAEDYDERNRWLALRHAFGWYGGNGLHVINMAFWVGAFGVAVQAGYSIYGVVGALIIAVSILASSLGTQSCRCYSTANRYLPFQGNLA